MGTLKFLDTKMEQEKINIVKQVLFESFLDQYKSISQFVNKLPINSQMKSIILKNFDDGYLWTKEAFLTLDLKTDCKEQVKFTENVDVDKQKDAA